KFEYYDCRRISKEIKPDIWISMHDMTPTVICKNQFVYCHNPSPFYQSKLFDLKMDPSFFIFTLLYKYLYKINIKKNKAVIVQQDWLAHAFKKWYGVKNILVSKPEENDINNISLGCSEQKSYGTYFYPALARTFKNFEVIGEAVQMLSTRNPQAYAKLNIILTIDGEENKYANYIYNKYSHLKAINFVGRLTRNEVNEYYSKVDVLLFPSKLETWGLPISEAKMKHLPMLVADLSYAKETVGTYDKVTFIDINDPNALAELFERCITGQHRFEKCSYVPNEDYIHSNSWSELAQNILNKACSKLI
ncbi:TPA: glycosyltransferase, partial [Escherichia coli]|nr:glycosyltransferase [Escherichia coli]